PPQGRASSVGADLTGVQAIRLAGRQGFCKAVNAGIAAAKSPIVEFLNDDTEVTAGWAEAALACFQDPKVAAVAPLVFCKAPAGDRAAASAHAVPTVDSAGDRYYIGGVAGKRGHRQALNPTYLQPCRVFGAS